MSSETHIVSLLVHVRPPFRDEVIRQAQVLPFVEHHADTQAHKLILVFEVESEAVLAEWFDVINNWQGVLSTQLCYHHCESLESLQEEIHHAHHPA